MLDYFATTPTLYIGMNGGHAILKMDLNTFQITGYPKLIGVFVKYFFTIIMFDHE